MCRRGDRSSKSSAATATPAVWSAWQITCFIVMPRTLAAAATAATVDVLTRRLKVVDTSMDSSATKAGDCCGAVVVAIARASSGDGRRALSGAFMLLRPYVTSTNLARNGCSPYSRIASWNAALPFPTGITPSSRNCSATLRCLISFLSPSRSQSPICGRAATSSGAGPHGTASR